jgi:hypothetical protein
MSQQATLARSSISPMGHGQGVWLYRFLGPDPKVAHLHPLRSLTAQVGVTPLCDVVPCPYLYYMICGPCHKDIRGYHGMHPLIFNLGTRWR